MKFFSVCNDCIICACSGSICLAGHGDDDFCIASKEQLLLRYKTGKVGGKEENRSLTKDELNQIKSALLKYYKIDVDKKE
jgi:hypothetical protein